MKVILQDYEPRQTPFADGEARKAPVSVAAMVRKPRLRLNPVGSDLRLFHAL